MVDIIKKSWLKNWNFHNQGYEEYLKKLMVKYWYPAIIIIYHNIIKKKCSRTNDKMISRISIDDSLVSDHVVFNILGRHRYMKVKFHFTKKRELTLKVHWKRQNLTYAL